MTIGIVSRRVPDRNLGPAVRLQVAWFFRLARGPGASGPSEIAWSHPTRMGNPPLPFYPRPGLFCAPSGSLPISDAIREAVGADVRTTPCRRRGRGHHPSLRTTHRVVESGWRSGRGDRSAGALASAGRKVRTGQGTVVANSNPARAEGKCHRKHTALDMPRLASRDRPRSGLRRSLMRHVKGKGEKVR